MAVVQILQVTLKREREREREREIVKLYRHEKEILERRKTHEDRGYLIPGERDLKNMSVLKAERSTTTDKNKERSEGREFLMRTKEHSISSGILYTNCFLIIVFQRSLSLQSFPPFFFSLI
jgi:hypothetical protein